MQGQVTIKQEDEVKGRFLRLRSDVFDLTLPTGQTIKDVNRDFLKTKNAVSILPYCPVSGKEGVLLIRQFRYPVYQATKDLNRAWIYETVAGTMKPEEHGSSTAVREMEEETGIVIEESDLIYGPEIFPSPGICWERIQLYFVALPDWIPPTKNGLEEENEHIISEWMSFDKVRSLVKSGRIEDGKLLLSLAHLKLL